MTRGNQKSTQNAKGQTSHDTASAAERIRPSASARKQSYDRQLT